MQDVIARLFEHFTNCYAVWNRKDIPYGTNPLDRINGGDCGTAAIAVGWVLEQLFGTTVTYVDNQFHGYIKVNGICYDTLNPSGQRDEDQMFGRYMNISPVNTRDVRVMHYWFVRKDALAYSWVCEFCGLYHVKPYRLTNITGIVPEVTELEEARRALDIEKERYWNIIIDNNIDDLPKNEKFLLEWVESREPRLDRTVLAEVTEFEGNWYLHVNGHLCIKPTGLLQYRRLKDILMSHQLM